MLFKMRFLIIKVFFLSVLLTISLTYQKCKCRFNTRDQSLENPEAKKQQ